MVGRQMVDPLLYGQINGQVGRWQTDKHADMDGWQVDRLVHKCQVGRQINGQLGGQMIDRQTNIWTYMVGWQVDRWVDKWLGRWVDRQTYRQMDGW